MKNYLVIIMAIIFASCSTTHKTKTESHKTIDSSVITVKDTTNVSKEAIYTDNFIAKGIDITFDYNNESDSVKKSDTVAWKPFYYTPNKQSKKDETVVSRLIQEAVASSGTNGRIPSHVTIHIDSLGDSTTNTVKSDSVVGKQNIKTTVQTKEDNKSKDVKRSGLGIGVYVIVGIIALVLVGVVLLKFKII